MIKALTLFLALQLVGETAARALQLPVPGPVLGMALLLAVLLARGRLKPDVAPVPDWLGETADGLLKHLSLLFVPASVGLVQHLDRLEREWVAIGLALLVSTVAAIAVGAFTFVAVARLTDHRATGDELKGGGGS